MQQVERISTSRAERTSWAMNDIMRPVYSTTVISEIDRARVASMREANRAVLGPAGRLFAQMVEVLAEPEQHLLNDQERQLLAQD